LQGRFICGLGYGSSRREKMKKMGFAFLLAIVALGVNVAAAPEISVDSAIYDFGNVVEGIAVSHTFILSNVGDEPLLIERVRASCGCTTTTFPKDNLAPGEATELEVIVDTAGFGGSISKSIYIESNDPTSPKQTLKIMGTVTRAESYHVAVGNLNDWFYLLIDLRDPEDYLAAHLMGAINLPYAKLDDWIKGLPREALIILYDEDGSLSDQAAQTLQEAGFTGAGSLLGGLGEWTRHFHGRFMVTATTD
jgi:rhodanese-related sulfurtransferase